MTTFMMKLHLRKNPRIFTMDVDTYEKRDDALLTSCLEQYPAAREIGNDETNGIFNNIYITDDTQRLKINAEVSVGFLDPRRIFLLSEDEDTYEMLVWMADVVSWLANAVNFFAYEGKFYERVDKTREMIEEIIDTQYYSDDDERFRYEFSMLRNLENREENPAFWLAWRKAKTSLELCLTEQDSGRVHIFHSPEVLAAGLDNMLEDVMSWKTKELSYNTELVFSCNSGWQLEPSLQKPLRLFEGSDEQWLEWEKDITSIEYTDDDFLQIVEGNREKVKGEKIFSRYFEKFCALNKSRRHDFFEALSELYQGWLYHEAAEHESEYRPAVPPIPRLDQIRAMTLGFAVGDALGVPVEFYYRETLDKNPVTGMRAYGTHKQPSGTWSDDTSMTLATMESIARIGDIDFDDIMKNFIRWTDEAAFTATGEVFDVGVATAGALHRFKNGTPALECGSENESENGNGSLMRMLPFCAYLVAENEWDEWFKDLEIVEAASSLTHAHPRSLVACRIFAVLACTLFYAEPDSIHQCIEYGLDDAKGEFLDENDLKDYSERTGWQFYSSDNSDADKDASGSPSAADEELSGPDLCVREAKTTFARLLSFTADHLPPRDEIKSSGYVVDTLEAALWCLLSTDDYRSAVLAAVNLGEDTDTIAAITGGLAGLAYGVDAIPGEWLDALQNREYIEEICRDFHRALMRSE